MSSLQELAGHRSPCYSTLSLYHGSMVNYNVLFWMLRSDAQSDMIIASRKVSAWRAFAPRCTKEGGERMSDYEIIMVILTVLSLVVVLITKDQK